ncbi:TRAP transporter small permease subunit [Kordiimonas aestuarii]|uniref:TRAP transporter small permease subunit n=1 Tax=Kordiimonas aestuarii TaxID=1005925 RepID=UPI0021D1ECF9|nr:TRAP transporter small permease subunit [Kordiimonas aestuarii]
MMRTLLSFSQQIERLSSIMGRIGAWAIIALMLVIITDVALRRWFVIGSTKLQELEWHLHGALFLLCLGWAYGRNAHVRIELVSERLSDRTRAWIELLGCLLFLTPYVAAILIFGADYVSYSFAYNEASASPTGLSNRWIIKAFIPIGFALLGITAVSRCINAIAFLFGDEEAARMSSFSRTHAHEGES